MRNKIGNEKKYRLGHTHEVGILQTCVLCLKEDPQRISFSSDASFISDVSETRLVEFSPYLDIFRPTNVAIDFQIFAFNSSKGLTNDGHPI